MALIVGNGLGNTLNGTNGIDIILGGGGNDQLFGLGGSDLLDGGAGNDLLDGGAGSEIVYGGAGNDALVYKASENVGACDLYIGGIGTDTLRLVLTSAEAAAAAADIAAFHSSRADRLNRSKGMFGRNALWRRFPRSTRRARWYLPHCYSRSSACLRYGAVSRA